MGVGTILALALSLGIALVLFYALKKITPLLINGALGLVVFYLFSAFGIIKVPIDALTLLIAALGGVVGVAIVLALSAFGIAL